MRDPLRKLITWTVLFFAALLVMHFLVACQHYPNQAAVKKQNTHRYNPVTGR